METYISILRGINVSGKRIIKMDALSKMFEKLKFKNTKTYIQSGNVVFQSPKTECEVLENQLSKQILKQFNLEVPVIVKSQKELIFVSKNNPFVNTRNEDITKLHVTFLSETPEQTNIDKIKVGIFGNDEFIISGKAIYLFCPDGYGNTKLSNAFFETKLKVTATTRNWKTIGELVKIAENIVGKS